MAFKTTKPSPTALDSPEAMFRDIKTKKVKGPLADQADLWRAYQETALQAPDVALQLPTGGGKTLVGIGLAEWRRQRFHDRVVMLCPTRQLVNQVAHQANELYGIRVHAFTGSKAQYDSEAQAQYQNCERVAVTTYSSLFNAAPFFSDPHVIILDDAHAAEKYIANMWSLAVDRSEEDQSPLYESIVAALKPHLPASDYARMANPERWASDRQWIDKVPTPTWLRLIPEIIPIIDAHYRNSDEHRFVWPAIRDHLHACHLYAGVGELLLRPLLPPTDSHGPFTRAKQRIYMSATLGEAGELERITGRRDILRLKGKASWDRQTIGRRYFMFPERALDEDGQRQLCAGLMKEAGRTLVLTPDGRRANEFRQFVQSSLGYPVIGATDIETSKAGFVGKKHAVAVVPNRYDGIDFPEDECRLVIIEGLPRATNLQERFLILKMGAVSLLDVRITTRLVQAFGRCTRSDQDYSAVVILGEELNKHLMTPERRMLLQPELHAELLFGIEQSKGATQQNFIENFQLFIAQGDEWRDANADILAKRDALSQQTSAGAKALAASAPLEIEYQMALWHGDFERALDTSRKILALLTDAELRGYRALWHYLAGSASWAAFEQGRQGFDSQARTQFEAAIKSERTIPWLIPLSKLVGLKPTAAEKESDERYEAATLALVERLEGLFQRLGTLHDFRFAPYEAEVREKIARNDATDFEEGHRKLGELLGYEAGNRNDPGAPDPWWLADASLCIVFEDYSDADPASSISIKKARQAASHPNWIRANVPAAANATVMVVLVTATDRADKDALPHLNDVYLWDLREFREWARIAIETIRDLRRIYPGMGDLVWRATAAEKLVRAQIAPRTLIAMLEARKQKARKTTTPPGS